MSMRWTLSKLWTVLRVFHAYLGVTAGEPKAVRTEFNKETGEKGFARNPARDVSISS